jgi:hypothetical protein
VAESDEAGFRLMAGSQCDTLGAMLNVSRLSTMILALTVASVARGSPSVPNVSLEVTVQQRENGKVSSAYHITEISCWNNECELQILTLNQCFTISTGSWFYPVVERHTTREGDLEVSFKGTRLNVRFKKRATLERGENRFNLTFVLREEPSTKSWELVDFVGGITTTYDDGRVAAMDFVPLRSPTKSVHAKLDCAVSLPAL